MGMVTTATVANLNLQIRIIYTGEIYYLDGSENLESPILDKEFFTKLSNFIKISLMK